MKDKQEHLEKEVVRYKEQVSALQERLDSVSKVRNDPIITGCMLSSSYDTVLLSSRSLT